MPRETVARQRERERKEKVMLQSRCQRKVDGTALGVILFRLTVNSILMNAISENTLNEELNKLFLVKIQLRENKTLTEYVMEIQNLERRNSEYALIESRRELESQRRQFLEANQWADQAQREREYICVAKHNKSSRSSPPLSIRGDGHGVRTLIVVIFMFEADISLWDDARHACPSFSQQLCLTHLRILRSVSVSSVLLNKPLLPHS